MSDDRVDLQRRRFLTGATTVLGGVGALYAVFPFLSAWQPSAKAQAAGAPIDVDISKLAVGQQLTVQWRGKPVWIIHRSKEMVEKLPSLDNELRDPSSNEAEQPNYIKGVNRALKPEYFIAVGLCTHLGCIPTYRPDIGGVTANWPGGFYCPCHGSLYDLAGRVYKGVPAPSNLVIPPYHYVSDSVVRIGEDPKAA
jgi:ubiquinol-cytochrome c reductase iron-sulfur subunit